MNNPIAVTIPDAVKVSGLVADVDLRSIKTRGYNRPESGPAHPHLIRQICKLP